MVLLFLWNCEAIGTAGSICCSKGTLEIALADDDPSGLNLPTPVDRLSDVNVPSADLDLFLFEALCNAPALLLLPPRNGIITGVKMLVRTPPSWRICPTASIPMGVNDCSHLWLNTGAF